METVFNRLVRQAFILDEERIKDLVNVLQKHVGEPSISVTCADEATRTFDDAESLFQYQNSKNRMITFLSLQSVHPERKTIAIVEVASRFGIFEPLKTPSTLIGVSGTEERASTIVGAIEEILRGSRPWYSYISTRSEYFWWVLFLILLWFPFVKIGLLSPTDIVVGEYVTLAGGAIVFAWVTLKSVRFLFPASVFLIGQEKTRHETKEWARRFIVGAIFLSVVAPFFKTLIGFFVSTE